MQEKVQGKKNEDLIKIMPLKDHIIFQNDFYYEIKKGVEIKVHKSFLEVLETENVIKKG